MDCLYVLGFSAFPGIGTKRFEKLISVFGSPQKAWNALEPGLVDVLGEKIGKKFVAFRSSFNLQKYEKELQEKHIHFFVPTDKEYPVYLKQIEHPPFILFAKGNVELLQDKKTIGIVGTRMPTSYGEEVTQMMTRELVGNNFIIVSGMALGIDSIAHREAIKNNGKTIAVLGSGVDRPTPREHAFLYQQILDNNGLIIGTFSPGEDASKGSFPARNAIIAGISSSILVTEGASDSGSLITASFAKKLDRPVFAVPGQITSFVSKGTNQLIKNGAIPVLSSADILDRLGIMVTRKSKLVPQKQFSTEEESILTLLQIGPLLFDEIVRKIGKDSKEIGSLLSFLELQGIIKTNSEGKYTLSS